MVADKQKVVVVPQSQIAKAARDPSANEEGHERCACFTDPDSLLAFLDIFDPHSAVQVRETPNEAILVDRRATSLGIIGYTLSIPAFTRLQNEFEVLECNTIPLARGTLMSDIDNRTRRHDRVPGTV